MVAICFASIWLYRLRPETILFFSREGLLRAAVLGLLDPRFNQTTDIEFIPNMDGFLMAEDWKMM